jgi:hypothetical protein
MTGGTHIPVSIFFKKEKEPEGNLMDNKHSDGEI